MARWMEAVQTRGALAALDTHTVPPYAMLERPLGVADTFICNGEEGEGITGIPAGSPEATVSALWAKFPQTRPNRPRLLGVALPEGVQLAYGAGSDFDSVWVANPLFGSFSPSDLTGAGDCFRAGAYAYVVQHMEEWRKGGLELGRLGRWGHSVATECLASGEVRPPTLTELEATR
jgi:sugar/nucleoside kinase (ribokinase family)